VSKKEPLLGIFSSLADRYITVNRVISFFLALYLARQLFLMRGAGPSGLEPEL